MVGDALTTLDQAGQFSIDKSRETPESA